MEKLGNHPAVIFVAIVAATAGFVWTVIQIYDYGKKEGWWASPPARPPREVSSYRIPNPTPTFTSTLTTTPPAAPTTTTIPIMISEWKHTLAHECSEVFGAEHGYWCYVPGGTYRIGGWKLDAPSIPMVLKPFWVARYPLTVGQYALFIAEGGYTDERWWTPTGWAWKNKEGYTEPRLWQDGKFNDSRQPVVGGSWYEAMAYCGWLSAQVGQECRLPSAAEWEVAAAYDGKGQRRTYPWGEEKPTPQLAIYEDDGRGGKRDRTAPVGMCVKGMAACGALDMAGNVWEWTGTMWKSYPGRSGPRNVSQDVEPNTCMWLSDGYWWDTDLNSLLCGTYLGLFARDWGNDGGLRLCVSSQK